MVGAKKTDEPDAPKSGVADSDETTAAYGVVMYDTPQVAPDGHVNLSQEDIDARVPSA